MNAEALPDASEVCYRVLRKQNFEILDGSLAFCSPLMRLPLCRPAGRSVRLPKVPPLRNYTRACTLLRQTVRDAVAEMMLADHTKTSTELKSMVPANLKAALPTALDDASQEKLTKLRDAKPENFASEYDAMQVSAHKDAVSLFERYANGGEDPKLKDWAGKTLPALKHHLEMAQALDKNRK
jgi:hypothetical protein